MALRISDARKLSSAETSHDRLFQRGRHVSVPLLSRQLRFWLWVRLRMAAAPGPQLRSHILRRCCRCRPALRGAVAAPVGRIASRVHLVKAKYRCWAMRGLARARSAQWLSALQVGGFDGRNMVATVESFASGDVMWRREAKLPRPRSALAVAAIGDVLVAAGGCDGEHPNLKPFTHRALHYSAHSRLTPTCLPAASGNTSDALDIFDVRTGAFHAGPPLLTPRAGAAAVARGGCILLIGGVSPERCLAGVDLFDRCPLSFALARLSFVFSEP